MDQRKDVYADKFGSSADTNQFVENLLAQMQRRFQDMSTNVLSRLDEMTAKVDALERSIASIVEEAAAEAEAASQRPLPGLAGGGSPERR